MSWPERLPSYRKPWYQTSYAAFIGQNYNTGSDGYRAMIMNNGDMIVVSSRIVNNLRGLIEEAKMRFVKVAPDGAATTITADSAGLTEAEVSGSNSPFVDNTRFWNWPFGPPYLNASGGGGILSRTHFKYSYEPDRMISDGVNLWYWNDYLQIMIKMDYLNDTWEWVAGRSSHRLNPTYDVSISTDSPIGLLAVMGRNDQPGNWAYGDGYIYWADYRGYVATGSSPFYLLRRMGTTAPYPVETLFPEHSTPAGTSGMTSTQKDDWIHTINPTTGLLNAFNSDVGVTGGATAAVVRDGHYYYTCYKPAAPGKLGFTCIARINLTTGLKDTFYYGLFDQTAGSSIRDWKSNTASAPNGVTYTNINGTFEHLYGVHGAEYPIYEGFLPWWGATMLADGTFVFSNASNAVANFYQSQTVPGQQICTIDLNPLLNNPTRHDRANPIYETISNGSNEQTNRWMWQVPYGKRRWDSWDGSRPTHMMFEGLETNLVHPDWQNKVVFMPHNFISSANEWHELGTHMVKVLQRPGTTGGFKIRVNFEGTALKGYAAVHGMRKEAPTQVILS
jgi:hypothetical protein